MLTSVVGATRAVQQLPRGSDFSCTFLFCRHRRLPHPYLFVCNDALVYVCVPGRVLRLIKGWSRSQPRMSMSAWALYLFKWGRGPDVHISPPHCSSLLPTCHPCPSRHCYPPSTCMCRGSDGSPVCVTTASRVGNVIQRGQSTLQNGHSGKRCSSAESGSWIHWAQCSTVSVVVVNLQQPGYMWTGCDSSFGDIWHKLCTTVHAHGVVLDNNWRRWSTLGGCC